MKKPRPQEKGIQKNEIGNRFLSISISTKVIPYGLRNSTDMCCVWMCFFDCTSVPLSIPRKPGQTGKGPLSEARNSLVKLKVKVGRGGDPRILSGKDPHDTFVELFGRWVPWRTSARNFFKV